MKQPHMFLAILDTMWGNAGDAPHWFDINPHNVSGRRLYKLTGATSETLHVTNACPQQTDAAHKHGTPSAAWLRESFGQIPARWRTGTLLVCGAVAQRTYDEMMNAGRPRFSHRGPVVRMPHPAARMWSRSMMAKIEKEIRSTIPQ